MSVWIMRRDGLGSPHERMSSCGAGCGPVALIAFEDREQVERLVEALRADIESILCASVDEHDLGRIADKMRAALREFADPKPPKCLASLNVRLKSSFVAASCDEPKGHEGSHRSDNGTSWDATEVSS